MYLEPDDAAFMSRVFRQRNNEIAYCGRLAAGGDGPLLSVWLADTIRSSSHSVQFSTANCPPEMDDVVLHTHPNGNLGLSQTDRKTIQRRPERVMCVQGGRIEVNPGRTIGSIACYRQTMPESADVKLVRMSVILVGSDGGADARADLHPDRVLVVPR